MTTNTFPPGTGAVADAMIRYGGSFVAALGRALHCADADNARRIRVAWPEYWATYTELARKDGTL